MIDRYDSKPALADIFAQILREKPDSHTIRTLLTTFPTLQDLINATEEELRSLPRIGVVKARKIMAALASARTLCTEISRPQVVRSAKDIYDFLKAEMIYLPQEHFVVVGLDKRNRILFWKVVSVGSLDAAIVTPRQTFLPLLKHAQVEKAIFVHNHPSGDPSPSREDTTLSHTLKKVGEIVGVVVLDSIVCGMNSYCSLAEQGLM
ncbi:JAB domain-containing protein [Brevibacillus fulvus]|uniref:DNA repair protein RadC n=1 Tax=Brevibacillus fulvus TaxID=1125967 RepID=A0A938Y1E6_9BACL|nr:JAB domain-containing protein [Brevibacillus fulvus]MBM7592149.1 DNA repair protein RadC [Brevibacillus fulvus]